MRRMVSILIIFLLSLKIFSIFSYATEEEITMEEFYSQVTDMVLEYDSNSNGLTGTEENYDTYRLIVKTYTNESLDNYYGASDIVEGYDCLHILQYLNNVQAENAYNLFQNRDDVEYVEYDFYFDVNEETTEVETYTLANQVSETATNHLSWNSAAVNVDEAIEFIKESSVECNDITVAVIDSGVYAKHEYFKNSGRIVDSGFTYDVPVTSEEGVTTTEKLSSMDDVYYHGTHVTGIIYDNTMDNVYIFPYRITDVMKVLYSDLNKALDVAIKNKSDIINLSLSMTLENDNKEIKGKQWRTFYMLVSKAIRQDIIVVAASGNHSGTASKYYPGGIPSVITVAASDTNNLPAKFSDKGPVVDVAAPGVDIRSTSPKTYSSEEEIGSKYMVTYGTSMAAPLVAAAAATLKSVRPDLSASEIQRIIKETAYVPEGWDTNYGVGIVNFLNMVKAATTEVKPTITAKDGKIEMTAPAGSDSRIYYTLDGSIPTIDNHIVYTEPFSLSGVSAEMITAVCHENGKLIGEPVTTINHSASVYYKHSKALVPINSGVKMKWSSSNPNVASVDSSGRITGIAKGTAYIYAINENGSKFVYKVTVDYSLWQEILIKLFFGFLWYI